MIKGNALKEKGYNGIYAVGRGAEFPPMLLTLVFKNENDKKNKEHKNNKNIALVGKGLIYDCGGLSLKPSANMCNMKTDMGGSAAVLCGFLLIVEQCLSFSNNNHLNFNFENLSVTLCLAENAIDSKSYKNDDIIIMKSGKSVEIRNTDAEGRLCLGDGVFHATSGNKNKNNKINFIPDILIDMATLTGAQGVATGTHHSSIYCNDANTTEIFVKSGKKSGDVNFPVLYCPEFHVMTYASPVADLRNINNGGPDASVSLGGFFVEENINSEIYKNEKNENNLIFVHVDLAFPSFDESGATGYGVSLLNEYILHA
ncbi:aminopeptidase [Angomonas deanei]|uniref:Cytosol aminopeptidase family, catalytic domain containing protein, putative n=1 Tax=Angomonas deanei TaxID=59799 RepID=A0A7G2CWZ4_9TRYP|nr:aminopeptidase [Angomonas deanei]CAD2222802.1 Cytosol aminopeptidase family, catalytic domain containing protein, putative [Angomonas deanei]|eukprot:EPY27367.1 aminopeptidase [Angomonas deanei]